MASSGVVITREGSKVKIKTADSTARLYVELDTQLTYNAESTPTVTIQYKTVNGALGTPMIVPITELTMGGVAITDETVFDDQVAAVFFNPNNGSGGSVVGSFDSIAEMEAYVGDSNFVVVIGGVDYGLFAATDEVLTNDGGTIYPKAGGGHWVRQFDKKDGISPSWWGAQGDMTTDDSDAWDAAVLYCITNKTDIVVSSGVYRVTRQIILGYKFIDEEDFTAPDLIAAPSWNDVEYGKARNCQPINVIGGENVAIWGDFNPGSLTAIFYYGTHSGGSPDVKIQPLWAGIKNIMFLSQDRIVAGVYNNDPYSTNLQVGIAACLTKLYDGSNTTCEGLGIGILMRDNYGARLNNTSANYCGLGEKLMGHNATTSINLVHNYNLQDMYITGGVITIQNFWSEECPESLTIIGTAIKVNGAYFENLDLGNTNIAQIIIGDDEEEVTPASTAITLDNISITTDSRPDGIQIRNAKRVLISNSNMTNCLINMYSTLNQLTSLNNWLSVGDTAFDVTGAGAANVTYL